jgi:uncharacterized protein (TIGR03067 family)
MAHSLAGRLSRVRFAGKPFPGTGRTLRPATEGGSTMTSRILFTLAAALMGAALAAVPASAEEKKDLDKLQGTWKFTSMEHDGQPAPKGEDMPTITFEKDKFTVKDPSGKVLQAGTQVLDDGKKPKTVDAKVTEGEGNGTTMLGIYELDGDTLKACFDPQGKKRPTELKSTAGSGHMLVVLKREK